jgi:MFS transporter, DHA1 family, inner membrane transport protein
MQKLTGKEILLLLPLAFVQFTHILDSMILMPMAPSLKKFMDIDSSSFSLLVASYGFAAFASAIAATFWMDRFDRKKVLLVLYAGFLLGTFACGLSPNYEFFLAARFFTGMFGGVSGAVIMSIIGDCLPLEKRGRGMGILMMGFSLASVVGVPAGIFFAEHYSWHVPFFMICVIGVFVFAAIVFFIPSITIHLQNSSQEKIHPIKLLASDRNQQWALLFSMLTVMSHFGIIPYITDYMVNNNGFSLKDELLFLYINGGILTVICAPLIGKLADKYGRLKVFLFLNLFSPIPIYMISNFADHSFWFMIFTSSLFFIFSGSRFVTVGAMVTSVVHPQNRGGFMSLHSAAQQLAAALMTFIGGRIIINDASKKLYHYDWVGYVSIAITLLAFFAASKVKPVGAESNSGK